MMTLDNFRKTRIRISTLSTNLMEVAKHHGVDYVIEGWDFRAEGYTDAYIYRFHYFANGMPHECAAIIMRQQRSKETRYVYSWAHPCDEYEKTLNRAEASLFAMCKDEWTF